MNKGRRQFLKGFLVEEAARMVEGYQAGVREQKRKAELDAFFSSYESSYALTLAYPDEILIETARKKGIPVAGREKIAIVRDLFLLEEERGRTP